MDRSQSKLTPRKKSESESGQSKRKRKPEETPMAETHAVQIKYCQKHYDELTLSLIDRQLQEFVATSQEDLLEKLKAGEMDPLLESSNAITSAAIQMFGPATILNSQGCPVCTFKDVINHIADAMAVKYRRSN